jgi:hypothetical protein
MQVVLRVRDLKTFGTQYALTNTDDNLVCISNEIGRFRERRTVWKMNL